MSNLIEKLNKYKFIIMGIIVLLTIIIVVVVVTSNKDTNTNTNTTTSATNNQQESRTPQTHEIEVKDGANLSLTINNGDTIIWKIHWPHYLAGSFTTALPITQDVKTYSVTFNEDFSGSIGNIGSLGTPTIVKEYHSGFNSSLGGTITVQK